MISLSVKKIARWRPVQIARIGAMLISGLRHAGLRSALCVSQDLKSSPVSQCRYFTNDNKTLDTKMADFAFAFDIDGVLLRSSKNLPGASKALRFLHKHSIPFILLTNGGGKHESERVAELSKKFDVPLSIENFVQSHTPFQDMAHGSETYEPLKDKTVLVTGGEAGKTRTIAEQYGFKNVVTPADILMSYPAIWPFNQVWTDYYASTAQGLPSPIATPTNTPPTTPLREISDPFTSQPPHLKIDAVFIFNDPRDWALDIQLILDLLLSENGVLGTISTKNGDTSLPNNGWQQDNQPKLIFSNPDLFWAAGWHMSRLGQGGFRAALEGVWAETTNGAVLTKTVIGKPYRETYVYAEKVLHKHRKKLLSAKFGATPLSKLNRVFMIGDNPESDIRGANEFSSPNNTEWCSILLKTGVYQDGTVPKYKPSVIVPDVLSALRFALEKEGYVHDASDLADES